MDFKLGLLLFISAQICTTLALPPCTCTRNLNPVCGSDGIEYDNPCRLECSAYTSGTTITVANFGRCKGPPPPVKSCDAILMPVCGSDGNTYSNNCVFDGAAESKPGLTVAYKGPCKDNVKVSDS